MPKETLEKEFEEQVRANGALIRKVCRIYASGTADQEDLFQEIVIQLWRSYPQFRGASKFSTWLYRVAINTAISGLRKQKPLVSSYEPDQLPEGRDEPQEAEQARWDELYRAIAQLNSVEKAVVMLYLEDRSYEEMEEVLGISQGTLRVKMNRIREKLRKHTKNGEHGA